MKSFWAVGWEGGQRPLRTPFKISFLPVFPLTSPAKALRVCDGRLVPHPPELGRRRVFPPPQRESLKRNGPPAPKPSPRAREQSPGVGAAPGEAPGARMSPRNGGFSPKAWGASGCPLSASTVKVKHQVPPGSFEGPRQTNHENRSAVAN